MFNLNPFVVPLYKRLGGASNPAAPDYYTFTALRTVNVTNSTELQAALDDATPGDDIVAADGLYTAPGDLNEAWHGEWTFGMQGGTVRSGTPEYPIRLRSLNRWGASFTRGGTQGAVVGTGGANHIIFDGLLIDENNVASIDNDSAAICMGNRNFRSSNCMIVNCRVIGRPITSGEFPGDAHDNHYGIRAERVDNCTIANNYVSDFYGFVPNPGRDWHQNNAGIGLYFCTGITIKNNEAANCGCGIYVKGGGNSAVDVLLNYVHGCEKAIKVSYSNTDDLDEDSDLDTSEARPGAAGTPILIYKNLLINDTPFGSRSNTNSILVDVAEYTHYVDVFNNTLIGANTGIKANNTGSTYCRLFNNLLSGNALDGNGRQLDLATGTPVGVFTYIDNNVYHTGLDIFYWDPTTSELALADWKTTSGFDTASVQTDPQLDASYLPQAAFTATFGLDILNMFGGGFGSAVPVGAFAGPGETIGRV